MTLDSESSSALFMQTLRGYLVEWHDPIGDHSLTILEGDVERFVGTLLRNGADAIGVKLKPPITAQQVVDP